MNKPDKKIHVAFRERESRIRELKRYADREDVPLSVVLRRAVAAFLGALKKWGSA